MIRKILRLPQVEEATGESRSTIYKRISEGEFPKPVKLGAKSVGWPEDEIAAYNEARIAARDATPYDNRSTFPVWTPRGRRDRDAVLR